MSDRGSRISHVMRLPLLAALLWVATSAGADAQPGGRRDFDRFDRPHFDGGRPPPPPPHFRPPPPPPPPPPPRPFGEHDSFAEDWDGPPPWLPEWIAAARRNGYNDNQIAVLLEERPRIGSHIRRSRAEGVPEAKIFAGLGLTKWRPGASAPVVPAQQPPSPALVATTPNIIVPASLQTASNAVRISGRIDGHGKVVAFTVDGSAAPFNPDRSFSFDRAVPVGDSVLKLAAINEWGQSAESMVVVSRIGIHEDAARFAALNPHRIKGKKNPRAVALIIGVDQYESIPRAEFAENDARTFHDYAVKALGVPSDRVMLLAGKEARRLSVEKALQNWVKPLLAKGDSDVTVFFSGHGLASDDGRDLFLLPYDGDRSLLAQSAIRRRELVDTLLEAGAASVTMFLDTCYSGGTRGGESLIADARPVLLVAKDGAIPDKVTILAAAGNDQLSSNLVPAKHGLFSYFLMKGLEGDASPGQRSITAAQLAGYLADQIPPEAARLGRKQVPQLLGEGDRVLMAW
jgi:hypothetical protein